MPTRSEPWLTDYDHFASGITNVIIISHGWNIDIDRMRLTYADFAEHLRNTIRYVQPDESKTAFVGVSWSALPLIDDVFTVGMQAAATANKDEIRNRLDDLDRFFTADSSRAVIADSASRTLDTAGVWSTTSPPRPRLAPSSPIFFSR